MMASVRLESVRKVYENGTIAVDDFNLSINDGELMILVGPSGCGKSTVLRMIAGLEDISAGTLLINDKRMNDVSPVTRNIAMVFQNYALYPHMTVRKNIELSLKLRRMPKTDRKLRVEETATLLGLEDVLESRPAQLSGGQRQRVAMGRAIVRDPSVFLLDEPLSNLDAKLRAQVRRDISDLQKRLCATMVFVTHDQIEAMTMADRIVVMRDGQVQQVGTPNDLYQNPKNIFVADFIGSPSMNILNGCLAAGSDALRFAFVTGQTLEIRNVKIKKGSEAFDKLEGPIILGIRPEHLTIEGVESGIAGLSAVVKSVEPLGGEAIVHVELIGVKDRASSNSGDSDISVGADESGFSDQKQTQIVIKVQGRFRFTVGDEVIVHLNDDSMVYLFDTETQMAVTGFVETL